MRGRAAAVVAVSEERNTDTERKCELEGEKKGKKQGKRSEQATGGGGGGERQTVRSFRWIRGIEMGCSCAPHDDADGGRLFRLF